MLLYYPKSVEGTTPRVMYKINHGLYGIMMCKCKFINCMKFTILSIDADNGYMVTGSM